MFETFPLILVTTASIGSFMLMLWVAGIIEAARHAVATTQTALQSMRDPDLDELDREHAVQSAAIKLISCSGSLILRTLLALAVAFVPIALADWTGFLSQEATLAFMARWDVILIATGLVSFISVVGIRLWSR